METVENGVRYIYETKVERFSDGSMGLVFIKATSDAVVEEYEANETKNADGSIILVFSERLADGNTVVKYKYWMTDETVERLSN